MIINSVLYWFINFDKYTILHTKTATEKTGCEIHGDSLYCLHNNSVNLKCLQNLKVYFKKCGWIKI